MTCLEAREALVIADPRELSDASGELAAHLKTCAECGARAKAISAQTSVLASMVRLRTRRRRSRRLMVAATASIAAALVLAVALNSRRAPAVPEVRLSSLPVAHRVSVTVAPGQSAAVLATADTLVTVVWFTGAGQ
jgi:hypothetical protein